MQNFDRRLVVEREMDAIPIYMFQAFGLPGCRIVEYYPTLPTLPSFSGSRGGRDQFVTEITLFGRRESERDSIHLMKRLLNTSSPLHLGPQKI